MGRLDNNKNQILLLKACKSLKNKTNNFNVYLLGDGEDRKFLQEYIDENLLNDDVKILGFKENPYPYLKNSVASVLTSLSEGFSNVKVPVFQRHSWANILKTSSIFVMDPTLYIGDLSIGWGIGKNDNYYLENSSLILKTIINKMNIKLEDTIIYGTSAGGFLSIIMGIYLKGARVVADNAQLDVSNWAFIEAVNNVIEFCFDNVGTSLKYPERFNAVDAFVKNNYVPKIYLHVNICSIVDNEMQLVPFLQKLEKMNDIDMYNDIEVILHYEPIKGHDGLSQEEALKFIYNLLSVDN